MPGPDSNLDSNLNLTLTLFLALGFRNYPHRSALTGTMAPVHHTPWLEALDDSMVSQGHRKGQG